jgi:hypothetical protein
MIISIEDAKAHLNVTDDADDAIISMCIAAAENFVNNFLPIKLADMTPAPADLLQAVRMLTGHFYENREATLVGTSSDAVALGVWEIIDQHRAWRF